MSDTLPPHVQLIQMATGLWLSRIIFITAELNLADRLADGPKSAADLAGPTGTHERTLHRLMRSLAGFGILTSTDETHFSLTPLGESLKSGAPGAARETILAFAGQWAWDGLREVGYSLQTGKTSMSKGLGMELFDYLAANPVEADHFSSAMVGFHGGEPPTVAAAYDFSSAKTIVDVGGATGNMLAHILAAHAGPRGVLFD